MTPKLVRRAVDPPAEFEVEWSARQQSALELDGEVISVSKTSRGMPLMLNVPIVRDLTVVVIEPRVLFSRRACGDEKCDDKSRREPMMCLHESGPSCEIRRAQSARRVPRNARAEPLSVPVNSWNHWMGETAAVSNGFVDHPVAGNGLDIEHLHRHQRDGHQRLGNDDAEDSQDHRQ
jgi:hypothetical protein